jgi:acetylornithine deacetylase
MSIEKLQAEALQLLQCLIAIESFSKTEDKTADLLQNFLEQKNIKANRLLNNVWAINEYFDESKPTILLNSHHDTVKPSPNYTKNPFGPIIEDGKLYGLGSNDAGGALVSLLACFLNFYHRADLKFNLLFAGTAEEEISGNNGVELLLPELGNIYLGIVGEPTNMNLAIAEKGLLVIDCEAKGKAGHAAREEGVNAIYKAIDDINWFRTFQFPKESPTLGPVKMTVTVMNSGTQHNVVPDTCRFVVDIRPTAVYTNQEVLDIIQANVECEVKARSIRLKPSAIDESHPIVKCGINLGRKLYGSPTTSDKALMDFDTIKLGPGESGRSHTADEFIFIDEIYEGIELYIKLLNQLNTML